MTKKKPEDGFIDTGAAAQIVGLSVITLERMRKDAAACKELPFYRHGKRKIRYKRSEVEAYRDRKNPPTTKERKHENV